MTAQALLVVALACLLVGVVFVGLWLRLYRRNRRSPVVPPKPTSTMQEKLLAPQPPAESHRHQPRPPDSQDD